MARYKKKKKIVFVFLEILTSVYGDKKKEIEKERENEEKQPR